MKHSHLYIVLSAGAAAILWVSGVVAQTPATSKTTSEAECTAAKLGSSVPVSAIGEPVSGVTLSEPRWNAAAKSGGPYCTVNGSIAPIDKAPNAKPINFQVALPSTWNGRSVQLGGGGMNGTRARGAATVVERFRLTAKDTLEYEAKVENPSVFSRPFTVRVPLRRRPADVELLEYGCIEGERDAAHLPPVTGGRK